MDVSLESNKPSWSYYIYMRSSAIYFFRLDLLELGRSLESNKPLSSIPTYAIIIKNALR